METENGSTTASAWRWEKRFITEAPEKIRGDITVLDIDFGNGYWTVHVCQTHRTARLKQDNFKCM